MTNLCKKAAAVNIVWHFYKKKIMVKVKSYMACNYHSIVCCKSGHCPYTLNTKKLGSSSYPMQPSVQNLAYKVWPNRQIHKAII